jgi:DNA-binding CsgD family transcriptional regulator/tetratricopeptide (TPR) repeat protein
MRKSQRPLRGRHEELKVVEQLFDDLHTGVGGVIVIRGGPGIGKTRLLSEITALAGTVGIRSGFSAAHQAEDMVELSAIMGALFSSSAGLFRGAVLPAPASSPEQRFWVLHDTQALLEREAMATPLLIAIDDLQWADAGTAAALRTLPSQLTTLPIAWVLTSRPHQGSAAVRSALADLAASGATGLDLSPILPDVLSDIAADVLGAPADSELLDFAARAQGNPFLCVELLQGLRDEDLIVLEGGLARLRERRVPERVSASMKQRLSLLSEQAERAATTAASLGQRFSVQELTEISGLATGELAFRIGELLSADIFTERGPDLGFRHDLVREAVRGAVIPSVRRALDREAAAVLQRHGALPVEVASQLARSAGMGDEAAISTLLAAAEALGPTDPASSEDFARRALEITPRHHPSRGQIVARRAISLFASGRVEEAKTFADTALGQALAPEAEAHVRMGIAQMFPLSPDVRADNARKGLALAGVTSETRAWLWGLLFHNLMVAGRTPEALFIEAQVREGIYGDTNRAGWYSYEVARSGIAYQGFEFDHSIAALDEADSRLIAGSEDARERLATNYRCWLLACLDRDEEALDLADQCIVAAQQDRQNWAIHMNESWKGRQLFQMGRLSEANALLEGRFRLRDASMIAGVLDASTVVAAGRVGLERGDAETVQESVAIAEALTTAASPMVKRHGAWLMALAAVANGHARRALDLLHEHGGGDIDHFLPLFPLEVTDEIELVEIALAAGETELAELVSLRAKARYDQNRRLNSVGAVAHHCRGLVERSVTDLMQAVELYRQVARPLWQARALERLGDLLLGQGDRDLSVDAYDGSLLLLVEARADRRERSVRSKLRNLGVRRRVSQSKRPDVGWAALTKAEAVVADMASRGLTNREIAEALFISPHTVGTHLRHIFDKLGIRSRVQLGRAARPDQTTGS